MTTVRRLHAWLLLVLCLAATGAQAQPRLDMLLLDARVNGTTQGVTGFLREGNALLVERATLDAWRVQAPAGEPDLLRDSVGWWRLDRFPGIKVRLDEGAQEAAVDFAASSLALHRLQFHHPAEAARPDRRDSGLLLNYDFTASGGNAPAARTRADGYVEAAAFTPAGTLTTGFALQDLTGIGTRPRRAVRLETTWRRDFIEDAQVLRLGDAVSTPGRLGLGARFGGVQWKTDFGLAPGTVIYERPSLAGEAVLPSVLELYIDGQLRGRSEVPPGPFEVPSLPFVTGRGEATLVVRDLLGRQQVLTQPFYATSVLLKEGMREFALEAGLLREDYGRASAGYAKPFASALLRQGVLRTLTLEAQAQADARQRFGALSAHWLAPLSVVLSGGLGYSGGAGGHGRLIDAGIEYRLARRLFLNAGTRASSRDFRLPGPASLSAGVRRRDAVSLGLFLGSAGSINLTGVEQRSGEARTRIASAGYNVRIGSTSVSVSASQSQAFQPDSVSSPSRNLFMTLSIPFGGSGSAFLQAQHNAQGWSQQASAQLPPPHAGGYGYRGSLRHDTSDTRGEFGLLRRGAAAEWAVDLARSADRTDWRAGINGGLALLGAPGERRWYPTRRIYDGVALVRAPGLPQDTAVLVNNQLAGRIDARGEAVVGPLFAYQKNRISVNPDELPFDIALDQPEIEAVTGFRSGVRVEFGLRKLRPLLVRVRLADGSLLPVGAVVRAEASGTEAFAGFDGRAYFDSIDLPAEFSVRGATPCRFRIGAPPADPGLAVEASCR